MSDCLSNCCDPAQPEYPPKARCPVNGREYHSVPLKTLLHHLRQPWLTPLAEQGYYFCNDPACDVAYFGEDGSVFPAAQLRTRLWQKLRAPGDTLCYCFGVSPQQAAIPGIKEFVVQQTKQSLCACEISNPSGRCCLKDFPLSKE